MWTMEDQMNVIHSNPPKGGCRPQAINFQKLFPKNDGSSKFFVVNWELKLILCRGKSPQGPLWEGVLGKHGRAGIQWWGGGSLWASADPPISGKTGGKETTLHHGKGKT